MSKYKINYANLSNELNMGKSILFCIWGQLRGSNTCGPMYEKFIKKYNADLIMCCNNIKNKNSLENSKLYGKSIHTYFYDPPSIDDIWNIIQKKNNEIDINYFKQNYYKNHNTFSFGNMQTYYNWYVLCNTIDKFNNYDFYVILRSDLYIFDEINLPDLNLFDEDKLYRCMGHSWGGLNNQLLITSKNYVKKIICSLSLNFFKDIHRFEDYYHKNNVSKIPNGTIGNIESILNVALNFYKIEIAYIENIFFITFDNYQEEAINTWAKAEYNIEDMLHNRRKKVYYKYWDQLYRVLIALEKLDNSNKWKKLDNFDLILGSNNILDQNKINYSLNRN